MTISNYDIIDICKYFQIKLKGVFMKDELNFKPEIGNYIINLDNSSNSGTHWTLLILTNKIALYFDSFGCVPPEMVAQFIRKKYKNHTFNNNIIQNIKSEQCGYYCLGLLIFIKYNSKLNLLDSTNGYINIFKDDTIKNDNILKEYFLSFNPPKELIKKLL